MAVGDLMLARSIGRRIQSDGATAPFRQVASILAEADLLVGNLECAISIRGNPVAKTYRFRAPPKAARGLAEVGFDIVGLANNHALDYGPVALADTLSHLERNGVAHAGAGTDRRSAREPAIVTRNGLRIAFLSYVDAELASPEWASLDWEATEARAGLAYGRPDEVAADVEAAGSRADVVIVMLHAGRELRRQPTRSQRRLALAATEAGAALVIGAHPHRLQAAAWKGDGYVAWSLGNFVFDRFGGTWNDTAILDVTLTAEGVSAVRWRPAVIEDGFPRKATRSEARRIREQLEPG
jgi:poly-gamma-glutamate synthesis protein (capsule biosynthesis protein)